MQNRGDSSHHISYGLLAQNNSLHKRSIRLVVAACLALAAIFYTHGRFTSFGLIMFDGKAARNTPPRGSLMKCIGDSFDNRRCLFQHVCVVGPSEASDPSKYEILYGLEDSQSSNIIDPMTEADQQSFVSLRVRARSFPKGRVDLGLRQVPFAHLATFSPMQPGTTALYQILATEDMNFGHAMLDDMFGVWENLKELGLEQDPHRIAVMAFRNCDDFEGTLAERCLRQERDLWPTVTSKPIRSFSAAVADGRAQCFERLVVGQSASGAIYWGSNNANRAATYRQFRDDIYRAHGLSAESIRPLPTSPAQITILMLQKKGRRSFIRFNETAESLRAHPDFKDAKWVVTDSFNRLPFAEQLRLLSESHIVVSPCGGLSMSLLLLQSPSSAIIADFPEVRSDEFPTLISASMEGHLWTMQSHVFVQRYRLEGAEDFQLPEGVAENDWTLRNEANIVLHADKLEPLLRRALFHVLHSWS